MTNSAPASTWENTSSSSPYNGGQIGTSRTSPLSRSVLLDFTRRCLLDQFTSAHRNARTSEGHRSPAWYARPTISRHCASGQLSIIAAASAAVT
ncbi:MAG: hypothetical protein ABFD92_16470 [Planctomycetaceae bacterium]